MSEDKFSVETTATIYHDGKGYNIAVGPDTDDLGLCRIFYTEGPGGNDREIIIPWEMASMLAEAIRSVRLANHV